MSNILIKISTNKFCNRCLELARYIGVDSICYRAFFYYMRKHPLDYMMRSENFFAENIDKIEKNISYLYDEKSKDIYRRLIAFRCKKDYREFPVVDKDQYFVKDIITLTNSEVFIDGGGYIGDTTEDFIDRVNNKYRRVVIFEPDQTNYNSMRKIVSKYDNIITYNKGLYSKTTALSFKSSMGTSSNFDERGDIVVPVTAIDSIEECKDATFIKMDIEGAELKALMGAKETIVKNKPKLAICLYHSDEDMLNIIEYVHELVPEYRLFVRHHSKRQGETVLYAVL